MTEGGIVAAIAGKVGVDYLKVCLGHRYIVRACATHFAATSICGISRAAIVINAQL